MTGSSTTINKSGVFEIPNRKKLEPFGQEVDPIEPPENETPDAFSSGLTVNEPEWLCALQNQQEMNFWDKAVLCQIAQLENEELIKVSVVTRTKSIAYLDSKTPNFGSPYSSPSDNVLTLAKRATYKSEDEKKSPTKTVEGGKLGHVEVYAEDSPIDLGSIPGTTAEFDGNGGSENMRNFLSAVQSTRKILQGDTPCSKLFGTAGEAALNAIERAVTKAGDDAFQALDKSETGIQMSISTFVPPSSAVPGQILSLDGSRSEYGSIEPDSIIINTKGSFVRSIEIGRDKLPKFGGYSPGTLKSRVTQLLHEIGHLIFVGYVPLRLVNQQTKKAYLYKKLVLLFPVDGNDPDLSDKNTNKVIDACHKQINSLKE